MVINDGLSIQVSRIRIKNFRIIQDLEIDCSKRLNVFVGVNGAGKSTLLEALKYLFSWFIARINNVKGRGLILSYADISIGKNYCLLAIDLSNGVSWKLYKHRSADRSKPVDKSDLEQLTDLANNIAVLCSSLSSCQLPLFAGYGVNRAVTELPMRLRKRHALGPMYVYNHTSLNSGVNFRAFFEWYREREDIENESFRQVGHLVEDIQLKAVREALRKIFPDYGELTVQRSPRAFLMKKGDQTFYFEHLSDGEKCYITLVADIARRLAMANPNAEKPLEGEGVILIDEVDLHLHPTWQSEVISRLREVFLNCQFFITTHSPFVVSNVKTFDNERFIPISNGAVLESGLNPFGQPVDMILLNSFWMDNLRNQETKERIDDLWRYLEKGDDVSEGFVNGLNWLKQHLDSSDSEFLRIALERAKIRKGLS